MLLRPHKRLLASLHPTVRQHQFQELGVAELRRASFSEVAKEARGLITGDHFNAIFTQVDVHLRDCKEAEAVVLS